MRYYFAPKLLMKKWDMQQLIIGWAAEWGIRSLTSESVLLITVPHCPVPVRKLQGQHTRLYYTYDLQHLQPAYYLVRAEIAYIYRSVKWESEWPTSFSLLPGSLWVAVTAWRTSGAPPLDVAGENTATNPASVPTHLPSALDGSVPLDFNCKPLALGLPVAARAWQSVRAMQVGSAEPSKPLTVNGWNCCKIPWERTTLRHALLPARGPEEAWPPPAWEPLAQQCIMHWLPAFISRFDFPFPSRGINSQVSFLYSNLHLSSCFWRNRTWDKYDEWCLTSSAADYVYK